MNESERRKYLHDLFQLVSTRSILIIDKYGNVKRIYCPFPVVVVREIPNLSIGDIEDVTAIKMDLTLRDIYIVKGNPYYYFNFNLYLEI